jgi:hypothetical protein|tara:strand:+ start:2596 stop:2859 length:264 start_codon:yes stop_codon:yes gene_type:complete
MSILIEDNDSNMDAWIKSEVLPVSEDFSDFLTQRCTVVKTKEGRTFMTVPFIFEKIDNSDVYIIRQLETEFIEGKVKSVLLEKFKGQ